MQEEENAISGQVTVATIHSAKGLEWPCVFLPAMEEGIIPHLRSIKDAQTVRQDAQVICSHQQGATVSLEEEQRLLYVPNSHQSSVDSVV